MNTAFTTRRRAEEFHRLIERAEDRDLVDSRFAELVGVLGELRAVGAVAVTPRPEFSVDLRSRLMTAAATELAPARAATRSKPARPARTRHEKKVAAVLGGVAIVTASASMAVAAQTALPGDTLYPLKRALENVHAGVQSGDDKGATLLANASDRLDEVGALSSGDSRDPQVISQTLDDFATQARQGSAVLLTDYEQNGHVAALQKLQTFTASSLRELDTLSSLVPVESRASLLAAASTLRDIAAQAEAACPTCTVATQGLTASAAQLSPITGMTHVAESLTRPVVTAPTPTPGTDVSTPSTPSQQLTTSHPSTPAATPAPTAPATPDALPPASSPPADTSQSSSRSSHGRGPVTRLKHAVAGDVAGATKDPGKTIADAVGDASDTINQALGGHDGHSGSTQH